MHEIFQYSADGGQYSYIVHLAGGQLPYYQKQSGQNERKKQPIKIFTHTAILSI